MNIALKCLVILTLSLSEHINANTFPSRPLTLLVGFDRGVIYSDAPYSDWNEFILYAKQKDEVLYASQTISNRHHINLIAEPERINVRIIPVSGGAGMAPLVLEKDVDFTFSGGDELDHFMRSRREQYLNLISATENEN